MAEQKNGEKEKTTVSIDGGLKSWAEKNGLNLSATLEEAIRRVQNYGNASVGIGGIKEALRQIRQLADDVGEKVDKL